MRGCLLVVVALLATACASARASRTTTTELVPQGGQALVVLLPDPGTGTVGRAGVSNAHGAVDLDMPREYTRVTSTAVGLAGSV